MRVISSLALSAAVVFITGLVVIHPTKFQAHTLRDELMTDLVSTYAQNATTPTPQVKPSVPAAVKPSPLPTDDLVYQPWWQKQVISQVSIAQNREYNACLFGDSISSGIGNTLGKQNFNFALGGMSTVSLLAQLKILTSANVKCQTAIIAMGTNDADYNITNNSFVKNLNYSIDLVKGMGATKVFLIPAFYSTVEASHNPQLAGSIARVEEINALIRQVSATQNVVLFEEDIQPLYEGQALKKTLTTDGVHLNTSGKKIYRQALLNLLSLSFKKC